MADEKISGMPAAATLVGNEEIPMVQSGANVRSSPQSILNIGTILPKSGAAATNDPGVGITLRAGKGDGTGAGGDFIGYAGYGGASGQGGTFSFYAGNSGPTFSIGGAGGAFRFGGGYSYRGPGGGVYFNAGSSKAGAASNGGPIGLTLGAGDTKGLLLVDNDPSLFSLSKSWFAGEALNGRTIYTATRAERVTAVIGRVDVVNGIASTLLVVKCASGTAPGAGTPLTSSSMDLTGTANTNQTLTLSATAADLLLAAGDSLCLVETGALGTSVGCITVHSTPQ